VPGALFSTLALAAVTVGSLHTAAPDHWVPFEALSRARGWSARRTAGVTLLCGFGHVTVSALFGLVGLFFGIRMLESLGGRMGSVAPILLIAFGVVYALWGLRRLVPPRLHGHSHSHSDSHTRYDHVHVDSTSRASAWTLFLLFSADPCVAVVPLLFAAAPLGLAPTLGIVALYEAATLGTMLLLVMPARAGANALRAPWLDRYGDAAAGGLIALVGAAVLAFHW